MHDYLIRTIRAYDENPLRYEEATKGMIPAFELDAFVALLPDPSGRVLDVGCAFGRDTALLAQRGMQAEGVDLSAVSRKARAKRRSSSGSAATAPGSTGTSPPRTSMTCCARPDFAWKRSSVRTSSIASVRATAI
jgi:SAM-dependent methyltransferase